MIAGRLPRVSLAHLPTAVEELPRLRTALQDQFPGAPVPRLLVKRDDQTGLATGGNKTRKLETLLADALDQGAEVILTVGAPQSNHCRQTAAAAARCGLSCVLVLGGSAPMLAGGNLLLDQLLGAEIVWAGSRDRLVVLEETSEARRTAGQRPYLVPYGGSNALGAAAYAVAMEELTEQLAASSQQVDHVVFASSSGGTQAGLVVGARALGFEGSIQGISVDRQAVEFCRALAILANETGQLLSLPSRFEPEDFVVHDAYLGAGYGIVGEAERGAIRLMAATEGLLVDPVYTARALAGLIDLIGQGRFHREETVLFWHTGGLPALFAYADLL
jgi:D-cysteine desulfhydrase